MTSDAFHGLHPGALVLVDSSALIYAFEGSAQNGAPGAGASRRAAVTGAFLEAAARSELRLAASCLAWTEALAGPLAAGDTSSADRARAFLSDSRRLVLEPVDAAIADGAARLMADSTRAGGGRLALADAIHLATALAIGADAVLTNDEAWRGFVAGLDGASLTHFDPAGAKKRGAFRRPLVLLVDELAFELD